MKIALAGNPNSGKTTLFNALTGSNQYVGNWPGVTVEKKEGKLKKHSDVIITDLPGIYSLSPYTLEEVVARNYLINERPDVILNIVDGSNLERNLYLTTQLIELGIPIVIAVNMMDIVNKNKDKIDIAQLSQKLNCKIVEISALKGMGLSEVIEAAITATQQVDNKVMHIFSGVVEHALAYIEEAVLHHLPISQRCWYAVKIFEQDEKVMEILKISDDLLAHIKDDIKYAEEECDDDAESIITNERYMYISSLMVTCFTRNHKDKLTTSDKIDRIVTNRFAALPIFAIVMFLVYFLSVSTLGAWATDWANDGLFGDGWHLFGMGSADYEMAGEEYKLTSIKTEAFESAAQGMGIVPLEAMNVIATANILDDNGIVEESISVTHATYLDGVDMLEPAPEDFGTWIPGIPVVIKTFLVSIKSAEWLQGLILDGIVAGVGAVLGFVPQMLVLFLLLAFLEACGYMARIAFVMDRIFRKFGLSGKSFIPMLIGTGCGVPGIMASRTIENERDRRMTIITTTFIPCGAKLPIIALIAGAMFAGAWWVAPSAYFIGIVAIILSGIILKKTRMFTGEPAVFVMELPAYHWPTLSNILHSMWERAWSFIKKAGTIILLSSIVLWFLMNFGFEDGFGMVSDLNNSVLAMIGSAFAWIFKPLGWGTWEGTVATITGLIAKENVVGTFGVLFGGFDEVAENGWQIWNNLSLAFTPLAAYSFLVFNLLCAPCFAAMGAIKREMNNTKWTVFAIAYQCGFAYVIAFIIYQLGLLFTGATNYIPAFIAIIFVIWFIYMILKPYKEVTKYAHSKSIEKLKKGENVC